MRLRPEIQALSRPDRLSLAPEPGLDRQPAARSAIAVVAGVLADSQGRVLVAQRPPGKSSAGAWEFPGGKVHEGESAEAALRRELMEELGIEVVRSEPLARLEHRYPERVVQLDFRAIVHWRGQPRGLEGQRLRWDYPARLTGLGLLPADEPVVRLLLSRSSDRSARRG